VIGGTPGGQCPWQGIQNRIAATYSSEGMLHGLDRFEGSSSERKAILYLGDRPVAIWSKSGGSASTLTFLTTDHLGTAILAMNSAGASTWVGGFEPFGRDWQEGTAIDALAKGVFLRLPGQWDDAILEDSTLGAEQFYNVHRWLSSDIARYSSSDPLLRVTTLNSVVYARSSPVTWIDPLGLKEFGAGSTFSVCCRPLQGFKRWVKDILFGNQTNHCYIRLSAGPSGSTLRTWSLVRKDGKAVPGADHPSDFGNEPMGGDCGGSRCFDQETEDCLDRETANYPLRDYPALGGITAVGSNSGPNSNTFARIVSTACGIPPSPLGNEVTAPGWNTGWSPLR
jgi:RHS repeat-associated protein